MSIPAAVPTQVEFHGLTKRFGSTVAVDGLTATVRAGVVTAFLGRNGAGKTTTLRMLLGLVTPTAGRATLNGRAYHELAEPSRDVGAMLEASGFHPSRSALNHLRTIAVAAGIDGGAPQRVLEVVGLVDAAHRKVGEFSLGMRQRLGLAAALLGDPPVLVLDEPANGLDPQGIRWLRGLLRGLARENRTVLVSSHVLAEVEQFADDVLVIADGRLVRQTPLSDLLAEFGGGSLVRTPAARRLATLLNDAGHRATVGAEDEVVVQATSAVVGDLAAAHGIPLHHLSDISSGLEDAFLKLTELTAP